MGSKAQDPEVHHTERSGKGVMPSSQPNHEVRSQGSPPTQSSQTASKWTNRIANVLRLSAIIFLLIFIILFALGIQKYCEKATVYKHFNAYSPVQTGNTSLELYGILSGEMKSQDAGFFVGDLISINLLLRLDEQDYYWFKNAIDAFQMAIVDNAEDPSTYYKDISQQINEGNFTGAFIQPGMLKMTKWFDNQTTILLEGDVVFTKEGSVTLSFQSAQPLSLIANKYNLSIEEFNIGPSYVKYQVHLEKSTVALAWLAMAFSALAIAATLWVTSLSITIKKPK